MAGYEKVFNAFGTKAWAQVAAATVIGGLAGVGVAIKMEADAAFSRWWVAVGGALVGLFAGVLLASVDVRCSAWRRGFPSRSRCGRSC
jgi:hypothetical protein